MKLTVTCTLLLAGALNASVEAQPKAAAPAPAATAAVAMRPGLWELSITEQAPNSASKRTAVSRLCYSAEDVKTPARVIPQQHGFGMKCDNLEPKADGSSLAWKVACKSKEGSTSGAATMTLGADSYSGQAKLDSRLNGKAGKLEQTITGKRVGDCK
jgi:hypothetical protein